MINDVYIYGLLNPIDNSTFYIGKTINPLDRRLRNHISEQGTNIKKESVIKEIISEGKTPIIYEICKTNNKEWENEEKFFISYFRNILQQPLTNVAIGGEDGTSDCRKKPINQYNLNGDLIQTFDSLASATRFINNSESTRKQISKAANSKMLSAYGYLWCYLEDKKNINKKVKYYHKTRTWTLKNRNPDTAKRIERNRTKKEKKQKEIERRKKNRKILINSPEYIEEKKKKAREKIKKWRIENPEKWKEQKKRYNQTKNGKERKKEQTKRYLQSEDGRKKHNEYNKKYYEKNKNNKSNN